MNCKEDSNELMLLVDLDDCIQIYPGSHTIKKFLYHCTNIHETQYHNGTMFSGSNSLNSHAESKLQVEEITFHLFC